MIMPIHLYGTKVWNEPVKTIARFDDNLVGLIRNMHETLQQADGLGLSATQVGLRISLFVINLSGMEGHEDESPVASVNPEILSSSDQTRTLEEGCLSIPGINLEVTRPESIIVRYIDGNLRMTESELSGTMARVFQHEYDHLHRKFITDRVASLKRQLLKPQLSKIKRGGIMTRYPVVSPSDEKIVRDPDAFEFLLNRKETL